MTGAVQWLVAFGWVLILGGEAPFPYLPLHAERFNGVVREDNAPLPGARLSAAYGGPAASLEPSGSMGWSLTVQTPPGQRREVWTLSPAEGSIWMMPEVVLASFQIRETPEVSAVALLYRINEGNVRLDYTRTYLVTCVLAAGQPTVPCSRHEIAGTNLANVRQEGTGAVWLYPAVDAPEGTREPGRKSDVHLLLRDQDGDGFEDLVLWRRLCRSMTIAEHAERPLGKILPNQCDLDLLLEKDELLWLRYDPEKQQLSDPRTDDRLVHPAGIWWRRLPGLDAVVFW